MSMPLDAPPLDVMVFGPGLWLWLAPRTPDESISTVLVPELSGSKAAKEKRREEKRREVAKSSQSIPDCPHAAIIY